MALSSSCSETSPSAPCHCHTLWVACVCVFVCARRIVCLLGHGCWVLGLRMCAARSGNLVCKLCVYEPAGWCVRVCTAVGGRSLLCSQGAAPWGGRFFHATLLACAHQATAHGYACVCFVCRYVWVCVPVCACAISPPHTRVRFFSLQNPVGAFRLVTRVLR